MVSEKLFSYGTLRYESVQRATFGRTLLGAADTLTGYRLSTVTIRDPDVLDASQEETHPIVIATGNEQDRVDGVVFDITPEELQQADDYEVDDYKRVRARLLSGTQAWVYVSAGKAP